MSSFSRVAGRDATTVPFAGPILSAGAFRPAVVAPVIRLTPRLQLFCAGDAADTLFEVIDGAVMLSLGLGDGRRQIVDIARTGAVIGLADGPTQSLDAEALVATTLRPIGRATLAADRALETRVLAATLAQMAALQQHVLLLGRKSALERVASFLVDLADADVRSVDLLGLTRQEIGDYLGLTIETVSRCISRLKAQGVIALDRAGGVRIRDRAALAALTGRAPAHMPK